VIVTSNGNESIDDALKREMSEEAGLEIVPAPRSMPPTSATPAELTMSS
jgi:hypothetical protein